MVSTAMAKTKKYPKNIVTIDRRTSKERRGPVATKTTATKNAKKSSELKSKEKPMTTKNTKADDAAEQKLTVQKEQIAPKPIATKLERREKVNRRRQIDPTTCEREYSDQEVEFMQALDLYKRQNGRMFPTCSEVLEVIRNLGYVKVEPGMTVVTAGPIGSQTGQFGAPTGESITDGSNPFDSNNDFLPGGFQGASAVVEQPYFG